MSCRSTGPEWTRNASGWGAQLEKLEERRESQISYLWEEYETTPDQAPLFAREELRDWSSIRKSIAGIREEIKGLGSVNVNAVGRI